MTRPGDLLTVAQARAVLPVGKSMLYQLIEEGRLPCHRVKTAGSRRGRVLIARADLEEFIAKTRETRPAAAVRRADVEAILRRVRSRG